jgi:DNA-3-methyladenine glycosylase II
MPAADYPCLETESDLAQAIAALTGQCRILRAVHARTGTPPLRDFTADFAGLARIVTGQQLSAQSAAAIWGRVSGAIKPFRAKSFRALSDDDLKRLGLSTGKVKTIRALAEAVEARVINFNKINRLGDAAIATELTALHGIGPWTAEIYLLFALRRADAFPSGDLALQLAAQRLFALDARPSSAELVSLAERWRPWRGAAARLLWADYALARRPEEKPRSPSRISARR